MNVIIAEEQEREDSQIVNVCGVKEEDILHTMTTMRLTFLMRAIMMDTVQFKGESKWK